MTTTIEGDPFAPDLIDNPCPSYARLRDRAPVHPVDERDV